MDFVGDSPLLAFHAPFDQHMLGRALKDSLGYRLTAPVHGRGGPGAHAVPAGAYARSRAGPLDSHFNLQVEDRHNASADALATAELALILFSRARAQGLDSPWPVATAAQPVAAAQTDAQLLTPLPKPDVGGACTDAASLLSRCAKVSVRAFIR
jgi:DNA polymerase III epsilon subunit-like protein